MVDFWLELGVDGAQLDAVPYLYEAEGTPSENVPTHAFLKELRRHVDARFPDRMLLAEANQWPEDAAAYFGTGDECHMAFHFPLMPRLYLAIRTEDRLPIVDVLAQTPAIPETCRWALFLRNQPTLEMVSDEERLYLYRAFAQDPEARINLGIRRRLAPLLGNDRRRIELLNALLCSLPGTPVIYYGDEIGMGDNVYLGDRNGVRTPMQWSADRNAGFSEPIRSSSTYRSSSTMSSIMRPFMSRPSSRIPIRYSTGCDVSLYAGATQRSDEETWNSCIRRTTRCWPSCDATRRSASSSSPTCRASSRVSSWICAHTGLGARRAVRANTV